MFHGHSHPHRGEHGHGCRFARPDRDHGGPHRMHRGGRGGLGRFFAHGDLRLVILALIAEKPRHGYEVIKAIEEAAGGAYSPSPGVIYPTLTLLEELGYVTVSTAGEGGRKLHAITEQGRAYLDANRPALEALQARMGAAGHEGRGPAPQILRAMENLKVAMRLRLTRGPLSQAEAEAIAAALDAAAQAVERS